MWDLHPGSKFEQFFQSSKSLKEMMIVRSRINRHSIRLTLLIIVIILLQCTAVKREDFRTCAQTSFCRRNRAYADRVSDNNLISPYIATRESLKLDGGILSGEIINTLTLIKFTFTLDLLEGNMARLRVNEKNPIAKRYSQTSKYVLVGEPKITKHYGILDTKDDPLKMNIVFGDDEQNELLIYCSPFRIEFYRQEKAVVVLNERGLLNFEHLREKTDKSQPPLVDQSGEGDNANESTEKKEEEKEEEEEEGLWEETFNGKVDTKPRGPESIAMDITFPGVEHVYGIPEHTSSFSLKETRGGDEAYTDPYRLYNLDVFEYEIDNPMALYGSIPFMIAHHSDSTAAVLWLNGAETWIDVVKSKSKDSKAEPLVQTHWMSETGIIDVFVFLGPSASDILKSYATITGFTPLPRQFAVGYHQCRWNYINKKDVLEVDDGFDKHGIPYDVIWLDIEHTDGKKYFSWDPTKFAEPEEMLEKLDRKGRRLVTIVDPHLKRDDDYYVYKEAKDQDFLIKKSDNTVFDGWCWPGSSSWVDYTNPKAQKWWREKFSFDQYKGSRDNLFIWNDMNEPSVFNGPEITFPKDLVHYDGWEHRNLHNIYGLLFHAATSRGIRSRTDPPLRPFVLSRAYFAGSQRYGAIWTGDNHATWSHLQATVPMLLSNSIAGMAFAGADVGGFFGNPEPELLVRWYQAGAFQPFFRAHAHIDTKRREPWLFGEENTKLIRNAVRERYALLPLLYSLFYEANVTGLPIMRPMFLVHPSAKEAFGIDDQFYVGDSLIVKPITAEGVVVTDVYLPSDDLYYDYWTYAATSGPGNVQVDAPLDRIPVLLRGGSIIPRRQRFRRSSHSMRYDPLTLVVALNKKREASGSLYLDDGDSYNHLDGHYIYCKFTYKDHVLTSVSNDGNASKNEFAKTIDGVRVERVIIVGLKKKPDKIVARHTGDQKGIEPVFYWGRKNVIGTGIVHTNTNEDVLIIKNPNLLIHKDWEIELTIREGWRY